MKKLLLAVLLVVGASQAEASSSTVVTANSSVARAIRSNLAQANASLSRANSLIANHRLTPAAKHSILSNTRVVKNKALNVHNTVVAKPVHRI